MRRTWGRCTICVERNLPSTYYCGEECMNAHWPKHKVYHKLQKEQAEQRREVGTVLDQDRSLAEAEARRAEMTGDECHKQFADAYQLMADNDNHGAARAFRKSIKMEPEQPSPYFNLALVLDRSNRPVEAVPMFLKAMQIFGDASKSCVAEKKSAALQNWARAAAHAFDLLKTSQCHDVSKPGWWSDDGLKALTARMVAVVPDISTVCVMRAAVLSSPLLAHEHPPWIADAESRKASDIKEAATWWRRGAELAWVSSETDEFHRYAAWCDETARLMFAMEEAEAADALAAAEAKAKVAADELLAEEEKEKTQANTKVGKTKGRGKKGKGKR